MRLLITGICGFVGSTLAKHFMACYNDIEIIGIDNFARPGSWLNKPGLEALGVKIFYGDVRQASDLELIPRVDWVIDAAANPSVLAGIDNKTSSLQLVENNLMGTVNLLEYCKRYNTGFILLSTSRVYSIPGLCNLKMEIVKERFLPVTDQDFPLGISIKGVTEDYSTAPPISLYGCTKLNSEQLALEYGFSYDFPVWINRCGVMAGAGQFGHPGQGIFAHWIHSFREKKPLKYIGFGGTGYQVRDCLHPKDIIGLLRRQFSEPLKSDKPRLINLSGGADNSKSLAELTSWCFERYGQMNIERSTAERSFDIPWMVLNTSKAKQDRKSVV